MTFANFVQIDSLKDLIKFEKQILDSNDHPLSERFFVTECSDDGEEKWMLDKENPFIPGTYFVWCEDGFDRL